jgi:CRISPR system Cascade subunit CasE
MTDINLAHPVADSATTTIHVTQLRVNPRHKRVRLAHTDLDSLHRLVMAGYHGIVPQGTTEVRRTLGVLYAAKREQATRHGGILEGGDLKGILVHSHVQPHWQDLVDSGAIVIEQVTVNRRTWALDDTVEIRTWVNPVVTSHHSKTRRAISAPNDAADWMRAAMTRNGCRIHDETLQVYETRRLSSIGPQRRFTVLLRPYQFTATITEPAAFARAVLDGVGKAKAYGAGLLHVQQADLHP